MIIRVRALELGEQPREIRHRNGEMDHLTNSLRPVLDGHSPPPVLITGPSGAGKTTLAKAGRNRLKAQPADVSGHYLAGRQETRFGVLRTVAEKVGVGAVHQATSSRELLAALRDLDRMHLVILDEADQLREPEVLQDLTDLRQVAIVIIATREERLIDPLEAPAQSRVTAAQRIRLSKYTTDELVDILDDRAEWGLEPGAVTREVLFTIAEAARGDARKAIATLASAARIAMREGESTITEAIVREEALDQAAEHIKQQKLQNVGEHARLLHAIIEETEPVDRTMLLDEYRDRVADPRSERSVDNYLAKLVDYSLVDRRGPPQEREYVSGAH